MTNDQVAHLALAALAAAMLAGCGVNWRATTWDRAPRLPSRPPPGDETVNASGLEATEHVIRGAPSGFSSHAFSGLSLTPSRANR